MNDAEATKAASLLRMKFEGGRFELNAMPASTLVELARLSKIFIALAEDIWKRQNPKRQRVPAGFAARFELRLADVGPGSTVPMLLNRDQLAPGFFDADPTQIAEEAARNLEEAFIEIIRFNRLPTTFPPKAVRDMVTIFSSLETNEYPRFEDRAGEGYNYTQNIRSNFVKSRQQTPQLTTGRIAGRLTELDTVRRSAGLQIDADKVIPVSFLPDVQEDMRASISIPNDELFVVIEGDYLIDSGTVVEITNVEEVFPLALPHTAAGRTLRELLSDDPSGEVDAVAPEAAEAAGQVLRLVQERSLPEPAIFPTTDGGVQLVWRKEGIRRTINIFDPGQIQGRILSASSGFRQTLEWESLATLTSSLEGFLNGGA